MPRVVQCSYILTTVEFAGWCQVAWRLRRGPGAGGNKFSQAIRLNGKNRHVNIEDYSNIRREVSFCSPIFPFRRSNFLLRHRLSTGVVAPDRSRGSANLRPPAPSAPRDGADAGRSWSACSLQSRREDHTPRYPGIAAGALICLNSSAAVSVLPVNQSVTRCNAPLRPHVPQ